MSYSTTHRLSVHVPWTPILAVLVTAFLAAAVIYAVNRNASVTKEQPSVAAPASVVSVPPPETVVERRALLEASRPNRASAVMSGYAPAHVPVGTTDATTTSAPGATVVSPPPRNPDDPYWRSAFPAGL